MGVIHGMDRGTYPPYLITQLKEFLKKKGLGGRVVSAANWQAWGFEFDSGRSQNFLRRNKESETIH